MINIKVMLDYKSIKTASGVTGYAETGVGIPLILVVGYSGTLFHWNSQFVIELAKSHHVYLIDNRKIGLSKSNNPETIAGFALDVVDFIQAMGLNQPIIAGWSMGGVVVQELLKTHEHIVSSAVLLATLPNMSYMVPGFHELLINSHIYESGEFRQKLYYYFFSKTDTYQVKDIITSNALKFNDYQYRFTSEAKALQDAVVPVWGGITTDELNKIQIPVLLLWAKDDAVVIADAVQFLCTRIKQAKMIVYSAGGHFLIQTNPTQIARDINNFLIP
jgi:pimeloyl-ACP methyl ester carboxylesterase